MQKILSLLLSIATAALLVTGTTAQAGTLYRVTLAQAPAQSVNIIRSTPWVCDGTECTTEGARSRPAHECIRLVRELGTAQTFTIDGEALAAEELAECNASAR
ncbi:MAG: hypothetical protein RLN87_02045 [Parasphingopyxis sp.]|uniref:CC_3452 family protein n=1 Tax=Parasphingopyxis sp. TaxID=1920299 RepID=UPI00261D3EE3|nr:hypothetical protein [uncultured Parasphingopyxis sp.]